MPGPKPDNTCAGCGRTIARDNTLCNACGGTSSPASEGDRKRAEWARAAAERDAAWDAGGSHAPSVVDERACAECGRTIARDQTLCNACSRTARDVVGDRKRAEWAHAATERDAAWNADSGRTAPVVPAPSPPERPACSSCGRPIERTATQCNACAADPETTDPTGDHRRRAWALAAAERDETWHRRHGASAEQAARRRRQVRHLVLAGAAVAITCVGLTLLLRGGHPAPEVSPAVQIANAATFEQAIAIARPAFVDTTDELGEGAQLLANYATAKLRWSEVDVPVETTIRQPDRGKRLCATGEIQRITRRELNGRMVHVGRLRTTDADEVAFVAVGTTGALIEHSTGRLCGAVIGKSGAAVSILGMFDLAENRMPLVEQP